MGEPYQSEVRAFGFNFAPRGWAQCNGQLLPISQNQALFALLGTSYGGDGRSTVGLPEMRGRTPISQGVRDGAGFYLGNSSGVESVGLTIQELPGHTHPMKVTPEPSEKSSAVGRRFSTATATSGTLENIYGPANSLVSMNSGTIGSYGGGGTHTNVQPVQILNYCIALTGIFPPRN